MGVYFSACFGLEIVRWACARLGVAAPPTVAKTEFATGKIVNRAAPPPRARVAAVSRVGIQRTCCIDLDSVRAALWKPQPNHLLEGTSV